MGNPSRASEFPNDNAEISGGAIWICADLTGPAVAEIARHEPVTPEPFALCFDDEDAYLDGPVELEIAADSGRLSCRVGTASEQLAAPACAEVTEPLAVPAQVDKDPEPTQAQASAFAHFESALVSALLAQGATRSAALVPRLLRLEPLAVDSLAKDVQLTLQSRGYLDSHTRYSQKFRELCGAWSAVLLGSSHDFAACGTTTLDRFGAELLAALLAVPATRADELRRELRKAGIAAFGVLEAA